MPQEIIIGRNNSDKQLFGDKGLIYIGKHWVKMGQVTSLSNPVYLDVARSHVVLIAGKRGSGKSYTLGVIAEGITDLPEEVSKNIAPIIFDTMGIYWTMAYKNDKDYELLRQWKLESKNLPTKVFVPAGKTKLYDEKAIPYDKEFVIDVSEISVEDWITTFGLNFLDSVSLVLERNLTQLIDSGKKFDIDDIIKKIQEDKNSDKKDINAAVNLMEAAKTWGVFASKKQTGVKISDVINAGVTTVVDLSAYSSLGTFNVRALVIGLLCKKLFNERMDARKQEEIESVKRGIDYLNYTDKRKMPMVWILIDEAHEFLPKDFKDKNAATDPLVQVLREGRQPGLTLVLATQQPGQIHRDVMTQSDIILSHRVTASFDIEALNLIMQNYTSAGISSFLNNLPRLNGSAIILDDNSERIYPIRVRPRFTWHGGEAPTAISVEKRI
ncbi:hypothetical protein COU55_02920 [Candidatus Pacearchaeota archaeon CG10_big_fil_rev_8_21_14_0_10_31_59]|nr:MAG: hypothetical protein COU55_02920 [Candidatus Pacearchaeota archaeon CG10_big_fil_rev_8_21_14_0_10_31_59]